MRGGGGGLALASWPEPLPRMLPFLPILAVEGWSACGVEVSQCSPESVTGRPSHPMPGRMIDHKGGGGAACVDVGPLKLQCEKGVPTGVVHGRQSKAR